MLPAPAPPVADLLPLLARGATALPTKSHADVAALAAACRRTLAPLAADWVAVSRAAKGWHDLAASASEEWASGPLPVARLLVLLQQLHEHLAAGRLPTLRETVAGDDGSRSFAALPAAGLRDPLLLAGCRARIDTGPDVERQPPSRAGDTALVLGAGNVTATPVLDVLHQVFLAGRAVLLKLSPGHTSLLPLVRAALQPLVDSNLLAVCCGEGSDGAMLARQPAIAAVHLTGSSTTWAAVRGDPALVGKQLSAEVGCCTPALVVPGTFRDREMRHVARQLAVHVACNGGATCLAPRVLLTARGWPQRPTLLAHLRRELAALPARVPFHPVARTDYIAAAAEEPTTAELPPLLRADLDPTRDAALCAREHFTPVLLEMALPGDTTAAFVDRATAFVRDQVFGSLAAYVWASGHSLRREGALIEHTITALPHGTVAVNCWAGLGYGLGTTPWGVPAGRPWSHGAGWTRGTACVAAAGMRRVVVQAPLRPRPLPPWLHADPSSAATLRALTGFYLAPSVRGLAAVTCHALRSL